mmetsp:Transcript_19076/g.53162  ORF Transcript_19076/g.53162 Transcript_19076/m.53162 type:complete len:262 (-) Transcript_19076:224-1009(-)
MMPGKACSRTRPMEADRPPRGSASLAAPAESEAAGGWPEEAGGALLAEDWSPPCWGVPIWTCRRTSCCGRGYCSTCGGRGLACPRAAVLFASGTYAEELKSRLCGWPCLYCHVREVRWESSRRRLPRAPIAPASCGRFVACACVFPCRRNSRSCWTPLSRSTSTRLRAKSSTRCRRCTKAASRTGSRLRPSNATPAFAPASAVPLGASERRWNWLSRSWTAGGTSSSLPITSAAAWMVRSIARPIAGLLGASLARSGCRWV